MNDLRISLVQGNTRWRDPEGNRDYYSERIRPLIGVTDLVVLPETFTSGFSSDVPEKVETMEGATVAWILEQARVLGAVVTGSVQLRVGDDVFNRLLWAQPDGGMRVYDKRHLFRYAGEHKRYAAGRDRLTVEWQGWRINPQVCYDLRFPVFCRNRYDVERAGELDFDLQIFVANWPSARAHAWKTLLHARAMENLCYVVGVNRVGIDGNDLHYSGDSLVVDPMGATQMHAGDCEQVVTTIVSAAKLATHRRRFPAMLDADRFNWE
ncbi:MAG: amidohydrolase [Xanthomonadaceae bacterium]|jgi:predicted amidohydrolase|nr:amidohydrolase [Xanthomonadaceae bacterium]